MMIEDPVAGPSGRGAVRVGQLLVDLGLVTTLEVARAVAAQRDGDPRRLGEILVAQGACTTDTLEQMLRTHGVPSAPRRTVTVDEEGLRELISVRDALLQRAAESGDPELLLLAERLDRVVTDLAAGVPVRRVGARAVRSVVATPRRSGTVRGHR
ncbi:MAG TPA: hypothetical protein VLC50_05020 [Actinomycetes bacterium]|nr:hypothetical protein [Actinomycetes bacterium]